MSRDGLLTFCGICIFHSRASAEVAQIGRARIPGTINAAIGDAGAKLERRGIPMEYGKARLEVMPILSSTSYKQRRLDRFCRAVMCERGTLELGRAAGQSDHPVQITEAVPLFVAPFLTP